MSPTDFPTTERKKSTFGRLASLPNKPIRTGSAITLDNTEAAMSVVSRDEEIMDEIQSSSGSSGSQKNISDFMRRYRRIQKWHVRSVLLYWICTLLMLIEGFVLLGYALSPKQVRFPDRFSHLKA